MTKTKAVITVRPDRFTWRYRIKPRLLAYLSIPLEIYRILRDGPHKP